MQLNRFTDLGIRVLMYLGSIEGPSVTIARLAEDLQVSKNHLVKVVHFMAQQQWLLTSRGKSGGIALAKRPEDYAIGDVVRVLEQNSVNGERLINCQQPPCVLLPACGLPFILQQALEQFYQFLNQYNLADVVTQPVASILPVVLERTHHQ
ncbi:MAG: Rrf2 family transcriptional regulator [Vitreoscilla sp.]|jgi:Rrf2 family nitric oxide-sensitive transcriptional repressor|nr:Rrf2 family transcriptional regulator [Vitreoscilla sp.]MBP9539633.1 Rrf2 family transcriptional regulator [Vitreoscilla sp.]